MLQCATNEHLTAEMHQKIPESHPPCAVHISHVSAVREQGYDQGRKIDSH